MHPFCSIEEAIEDIKSGKMVIVVDDENRENEGDLVMAAEKVTADKINFMATHGRGLICVPITSKRAEQLKLPLMTSKNRSLHETAFTISVDGKNSGTGISAHDRARTIQDIVDPQTTPADLLSPGHIFPLIANNMGVLKRAGHTEAACDLTKLAGFKEAGVICEILKEDGHMARRDDLFILAKKWKMKIVTIKDLINYRLKTETLVKRILALDFPCDFGKFKLHLYQSHLDENEHHIALVKGDVSRQDPVLVRIHSECFTGDLLGSNRCDCGDQLELALKLIEQEECGVLLYMRQEGRGIGLINKLKAYVLQDEGHDTVTANTELGFHADLRNYTLCAKILKNLGAKKIKLLTNNPKKIKGLINFNFDSITRIPIEIPAKKNNLRYLKTKRDKMGHLLEHLKSLGEENEYSRGPSQCQRQDVRNCCGTIQ